MKRHHQHTTLSRTTIKKFRLMKAPIQPWTPFMEILKLILHPKAHTSQSKMFVIYPNIIRKFAIKDLMAFTKIKK